MIYKRLGDYIQQVNERNRDLEVKILLGVSITKKLIPSIANTIGTDMSVYKIIKKRQFAYGTVTSRNGEKISIALSDEHDKALVSQIYVVFEVVDTNVLLPEYLMMWFSRPEFDRYARYHSHGSTRETFDWSDLCDVELPVPSIEKQREIVAQYQSVSNKIKVNEQICEKLEATAQALYKHWFVDFEFPNDEGQPFKSSGGAMVWNKELEKEIPEGWKIGSLKDFSEIRGGKRLPKNNELNSVYIGRPYIRVADMNRNKFLTLNNGFQYVNDETHKLISKYIVDVGDLIISIVGTIGVLNIIDNSLKNSNLTENCFKITNFKIINSDYLYHFLNSEFGKREIEMKTVGGVQAKLPMYNVETISLIIPIKSICKKFQIYCHKINCLLLNKAAEVSRLNEIQSLLLSRLATLERELGRITN